MPPTADDKRNAATLVRQFELLQKIKRELVKQGQLNGNATAAEVIDKLRLVVPQELWA